MKENNGMGERRQEINAGFVSVAGRFEVYGVSLHCQIFIYFFFFFFIYFCLARSIVNE